MKRKNISVEALTTIVAIGTYRKRVRNFPTRVNVSAILAVHQNPRTIQNYIQAGISCGKIETAGDYRGMPTYALSVEGEEIFRRYQVVLETDATVSKLYPIEFLGACEIVSRKISRIYGKHGKEDWGTV